MYRNPIIVSLAATIVLGFGCDDEVPDTATDAGVEVDATMDTSGPSTCETAGPMEIDIEGYHPEGIAISAAGTAFVGSVTSGQIVKFDNCSGSYQDFVAASGIGAVGMIVDESNSVLWSCFSNVMTGENAVVRGFALSDGTLVASHSLPVETGFCNDMTLDTAGNLYATESFGGIIFRVPAADLLTDSDAESWLDDATFDVNPGELGLNGITVVDDLMYIVSFQPGTLYRVRIDASGAASDLTTISLDRPLALPDGLKSLGPNLLLLVEGESLSLSTVAISGDTGVVSVENSSLDSPTTVAVFGTQAWVVQGQFDHLTGRDPTPAELPFVVVRTARP